MSTRDPQKEYEDRLKREAAFDQALDHYLDKLTRIGSLDELLVIVRDAATWARDAHRADMKRKAERQ